jgi:hypothetical protein
MTRTVAFFVLEFILQRRVIAYFFPEGGLSMVPGTLRIRIRTRLTAFLFACNIVPLISILQNTHERLLGDEALVKALERFQSNLVIEVAVFMGVGIWLTFLVGNLLNRWRSHAVLPGQADVQAKVQLRPTIKSGIRAMIDAMTEGLIERDRIKQSLALAQKSAESCRES